MVSIEEIEIPDELRPARASFDVMKDLLTSKGMKAKTLGYLCGMYTLQILFDLGEKADEVIKPLLELLEKFKQANQKSMFGETQFGRMVRSDNDSRRLLNHEATAFYHKARSDIEERKTTQMTVDLLVRASVLYQVSSSMFPTEDRERSKDVESLINNQSGSNKSDEELGEILSELPVTVLVAGEHKRHLLTNELMRERIAYCNYHVKRIIGCFKDGKDPNEDIVGIMSEPDGEEITQDEIDKTIADALNMPDDDGEYDEVFLEDQGAVIFPKAPQETTTEESHKGVCEEPRNDDSRKIEARLVDSRPKLTKEELEKQLSNEELLQHAAKYCKYAISAVTYDDVDTVISELKEALRLAERYKELTS